MTTSKRVGALLLYIMFLSIFPLQITSSPRTEAEALVRWKNSLLSSSTLNSWSLTNVANLCNWTGIVCNSTRTISEVNLGNAGLTGTLHQLNFTSFPNLIHLNLFDNNLRGFIPSGIGNLSKLTSLDLSFNDFDGIIPYEISNLQKLQILYLRHNRLKTPNWSKFKSMPFLRSISFSVNELTGEFPNFILSCYNLVNLLLYKNNFNGSIPESLFTNLRQLDTLALNDCSFEGPLSSNFTKLSKLKRLYLANNGFSSSIPDAMGSIPSLQDISLYNNSLEGKIPSSLGQLRNLEWLDLNMNHLNSSIPFELGQCNNLTFLSVYSNSLTGDLPLSLSNLTKLEFFLLDNNQFSGPIPPELGNCKSLRVLQLSNNSLSGNIPSSICNASSLESLDLSSNKLNGIIPRCLGSGNQNLLFISLSNNHLHGTIPGTFARINGLSTLVLNHNRLEGPLPQTLANCSLLEVLDIGKNLINDSFPHWTETLSELQVLVLRSNHFHGSIGSSKTKSPFPKLKILDIANNELTSLLPNVYFEHFDAMTIAGEQALNTTIGQSKYYEVDITLVLKGQELSDAPILRVFTTIDLSNNSFQGEIPSSIGKLKFLRSLNLSHNSLTSNIPPSLANLTNLETLDLSSNQLVGKIPNQLIEMTSLEVFNVSNNQLVGDIPHGAQFNTFENNSYIGNSALCGFPLTKEMCEDDDEAPQENVDDDDSNNSDEFEYWDAALSGCGCGMLFGMIIGALFISFEKLKWLDRRSGRKYRRRAIRAL